MCEIKTVLFVAILLLAAGCCIYLVNSDKKVEQNSHLKSESPCEKQNKKYCLHGAECYYLIDQDIVA